MSLANKEVALLRGLPESFPESQGEPGSFGAVGCVFFCGVPRYGGSSGTLPGGPRSQQPCYQ